MPETAKNRAPADVLGLLAEVYQVVYNSTESFEEDLIGPDLAYLMGAITMNSYWAWGSTRPLMKILQEKFGLGHRIWSYVEMESR